MNYIKHITINTGNIRDSYRSEVRQEAIEFCKKNIKEMQQGKSSDILDGYEISGTITNTEIICIVTHKSSKVPLIKIAASKNELTPISEAWLAVTSKDEHCADKIIPWLAEKPTGPWLAAKLYPSIEGHFDMIQWIGDFERVLVWAWLEL